MRRLLLPLLPLLLPMTTEAQEVSDLYIPPTLRLMSDEKDTRTDRIIVTDIHRYREFPLLPVLFFDHPGDAAIAARYHTFANSSESSSYDDTALLPLDSRARFGLAERLPEYEKYYEILDIIGDRMERYPDATITLRGSFGAGADERSEIAVARAETIRDYLTRVWRVAPERIAIAEPFHNPYDAETPLRQQEARAVQIETEDWEIIRPVRFTRVVRRVEKLTPRFVVTPFLGDQQIASLIVVAVADDHELGRDTVAWRSEWSREGIEASWVWESEPRDLTFDRLTFQAYIETHDGTLLPTNPVSVPVERSDDYPEESDYRRHMLLPFFSYRTPRVTDYHRRLLAEVIETLRPHHTVLSIQGEGEITEEPALQEAELEAMDRTMLPYRYATDGESAPASARHAARLVLWAGDDGPESDYVCGFLSDLFGSHHSRYEWVGSATPAPLNVDYISADRAINVAQALGAFDNPSTIVIGGVARSIRCGSYNDGYSFEPLPECRSYSRAVRITFEQ